MLKTAQFAQNCSLCSKLFNLLKTDKLAQFDQQKKPGRQLNGFSLKWSRHIHESLRQNRCHNWKMSRKRRISTSYQFKDFNNTSTSEVACDDTCMAIDRDKGLAITHKKMAKIKCVSLQSTIVSQIKTKTRRHSSVLFLLVFPDSGQNPCSCFDTLFQCACNMEMNDSKALSNPYFCAKSGKND